MIGTTDIYIMCRIIDVVERSVELAAALLLGIVTPVAVILFRVRYQYNQHSILFAVARSGLYQNRPTNQTSCGRRALLEYLVGLHGELFSGLLNPPANPAWKQ